MTRSIIDLRHIHEYEPRLATLTDELTDHLLAGEENLEVFIGRYPEHAEQLRQLIPAVRMMGELKQSTAYRSTVSPPASRDPRLEPGLLGDFRLIREVGRGGRASWTGRRSGRDDIGRPCWRRP